MNLYTVTTDDKNGHELQICRDEAEADRIALEWCREHWYGDDPMPENWQDAYDIIKDGDSGLMWVEVHDMTSHPIVRSARAQLDDLLEQVYQMQGMFNDDDGAIAKAVQDAEAWPDVVEDDHDKNALTQDAKD